MNAIETGNECNPMTVMAISMTMMMFARELEKTLFDDPDVDELSTDENQLSI